MATHQSAIKRSRQNEKKRVENKYHARTTRKALKDLRDTEEKAAAEEKFAKVASMLDKLAKKNIIHKNKAANLKSGLKKQIAGLK